MIWAGFVFFRAAGVCSSCLGPAQIRETGPGLVSGGTSTLSNLACRSRLGCGCRLEGIRGDAVVPPPEEEREVHQAD